MPLNLRRPGLAGRPREATPTPGTEAGAPGGLPRPPLGAGGVPLPPGLARPPGSPIPPGAAFPPPIPTPPVSRPIGSGYVPGPPVRGVAPPIPASALPPLTPAAALPSKFRYPRRTFVLVRVIGYALLLLTLWNLVNNLIFASNFVIKGWEFNWHPLVGAFLAVLGAFALAALLINAFPTFEPRGDGLVMRGFIRPIVLPWSRVAMLRSMELPGERYLVCLQYTGMPLTFEHQVYSLLAGLGRLPGVFITSQIDHFDDLLRLILKQRIATTPPGLPGSTVESLLDEGAQLPLFQMLLDPQVTAVRVGDLPAIDPDAPVDDLRNALIDLSERAKGKRTPSLRLQAALALLPVTVYWVDELTQGFIPNTGMLVATVGLFVLGLLELYLVALVVQALGETLFGHGLFDTAFKVYPHLELPRAAAVFPLYALLMIQGLIGGLAITLVVLGWLAAAGWTAYLTALFTGRLYQIDLRKAAPVGAASFAAQLVLVVLYLFLR